MLGQKQNHYVPNFIVKNFAYSVKGKKNNILYADLKDNTILEQNINNCFKFEDFFDVKAIKEKQDKKMFNKTFESFLQTQIKPVFDNIVANKDKQLTILRKDLCLIKKYMLMQVYKNQNNILFNDDKTEEDVNLFISDFTEIINSSWDALLVSQRKNIKKMANEIHSSFLMFFNTNQEFLLNDLSYSRERIQLHLNDQEKAMYIQQCKEYGKQDNQIDKDFDKKIEDEINRNGIYLDNYSVFPIYKNLAILLVNSVWTVKKKLGIEIVPLVSNFLKDENIVLPKNIFVNKNKMTIASDIKKYKDDNDQYIYQIQTMTENQTKYNNMLLLNETKQNFAFSNFNMMIETLQHYQTLKESKDITIKHDISNLLKSYNIQ